MCPPFGNQADYAVFYLRIEAISKTDYLIGVPAIFVYSDRQIKRLDKKMQLIYSKDGIYKERTYETIYQGYEVVVRSESDQNCQTSSTKRDVRL